MAGRSQSRETALGIRTHSGWACAILATGQGDAIEILDRRRIMLHDPKKDGTKQPFHTAELLSFALAENHIGVCRKTTAGLARDAVAGFQDFSQSRHARLAGICVITGSGRALPDLRAILASHALIHAAEGEFYRNALLDAASDLKVQASRLNAARASASLAARLGICEAVLAEMLSGIGKRIGRPWTVDEKLATMAAWMLLAK